MNNSEIILRRMLWLMHGCPTNLLYGDDGEMQCGQCKIDFKRDSVEQIQQKFMNIAKDQVERASKLRSTKEILQLLDQLQNDAMSAASCMANKVFQTVDIDNKAKTEEKKDVVKDIMQGLAAGQKSEILWGMVGILRWLLCLQDDPKDKSFINELYKTLENNEF